MSEKKFYVYEHWRPDENAIFYVGKGQKRRAWDTHRGRTRWHKFVVEKLKRLGMAHEVRIIEYFDDELAALSRERELIAHWRSLGADLVNLSEGGEGPTGLKHTEEWKLAMSRRMRGRKMSDEARAKMSLAAMGNKKGLGKKKPRHVIERVAEINRGKTRSPELIERLRKIRLANPTFKGRTHTEETIERIRALQLGVPKSAEAKARMRKPKSSEHKIKLRDANLGKKHSAESRAKMPDASRRGWEARRYNKLVNAQISLIPHWSC